MSITELARRSGLTVESVKQLNPSFVRNYIPTSAAGYAIVLPFASAELFNSGRSMEIPDLDAIETGVASSTVSIGGATYKITTSSKEHVVRSGDNLSTIAARNNCTVRDLMTWNGLRDSRLSIGQRLEIRYTVKELMPAIMEALVVAPPVRNDMTLNTLSALSFDYFPVDQRSQDVSFEIAPVVKEVRGQ